MGIDLRDPNVQIALMVTLVDGVEDEGQESYQVITPGATWFYHKLGAGFSSLLDRDGLDWLGYRPQGGSDGKYRGIPNLVHPEGYFHPGGTKCTTHVLARGPLKATFQSQSNDGKWAVRWDVFPTFAWLTVLKVAHPYWFLYEGTPGGKIDYGRLLSMRHDRLEGASRFSPPRSPAETQLAGIWREVLGIEKVGLHDNFFDLGGHSLMMIRAISGVEETMKIRLNPGELMNQTLVQVAAICEQRMSEQPAAQSAHSPSTSGE